MHQANKPLPEVSKLHGLEQFWELWSMGNTMTVGKPVGRSAKVDRCTPTSSFMSGSKQVQLPAIVIDVLIPCLSFSEMIAGWQVAKSCGCLMDLGLVGHEILRAVQGHSASP